MEGVYWPAGVERAETLEAFVAAFQSIGYVPCDGTEYREGFEKIVIYASAQGVPSHAARQLPGGRWTSKLGESEDIEHRSLQDVASGDDCDLGYGTAVRFLMRPVSPRGIDLNLQDRSVAASF
jgi:hypothetical protein